MNRTRYLAYRRVHELLDSGAASDVGAEERELIRDLAEQMLLTRARDADDAAEVSQGAALALRTLTARGDISGGTARELWEEICAAGPDPFATPIPVFEAPTSAVLRSD